MRESLWSLEVGCGHVLNGNAYFPFTQSCQGFLLFTHPPSCSFLVLSIKCVDSGSGLGGGGCRLLRRESTSCIF